MHVEAVQNRGTANVNIAPGEAVGQALAMKAEGSIYERKAEEHEISGTVTIWERLDKRV